MKSKKQFRSLNHKLLTYVAWNAVLLLLIAAAASFVFQYERSKVNTLVMLNQLLDTVEDTVTVAAYSRNKQIAEDVLTGLLKNDVVNKVIISSIDGFNLERSKAHSNTMIFVSRPIYSLFDAKEIIGSIQIQPSGQYSLTEAKYDTISSVISSSFLIGLTSLVILWVMRKYISSPLMRVSHTLNKIRAGEEQQILTLKNNTDDELGLLRTNINSLLSELKEKLNNEVTLRQDIQSMEQQLRHMYDASSAGLFLLDLQGVLLTSNSTLKTIINLSSTDGTQYIFSSFVKEDHDFSLLMDRAIKSGQLEAQDFLLANEDGVSVWVHCLLSQTIDSSGQQNIEGVLFDVTERVELEMATQHEAAHDPLTGLLRRQAAQCFFEQLPEKKDCCFLMMDLDGFKQANDTYGHLAGDEVLNVTAERLIQCVRSSDAVCRLGGDEFLVILYNYHPETMLLNIAERVITSVNQPIMTKGNIVINVGISIGLAEFILDDEDDFESLLKKSDDAMYEVKRKGKNGYSYISIKGEISSPKLFNAKEQCFNS